MTNLFSSKPKVIDKIVYLEEKSEAAISVFKSTLDSLNFINNEVELEINNKQDAIVNIKKEISILADRQVKNKKFVSKLQEFFE